MKEGDKVTVLVHGAGVVSEEDDHVVYEMHDNSLQLVDIDEQFYMNERDGVYRTEILTFDFWYEIKGKR